MKQTPKTPRARAALATAGNRREVGDAVKVFCRIRPMELQSSFTSLRVKNSTTLSISPPEQLQLYSKQTRNTPLREIQYKFKHIFNCDATQREVFTTVAQPLVENLIQGRDSLLFTYGVTGSGKTYTMTGNSKDNGILAECFDVLLRTISDCQAQKFVFKPDRLNGFEMLSEEDALQEHQKEITYLRSITNGVKSFNSQNTIQSSVELPLLTGLDRGNMYSIFISYIEIFNNSVYDLLEGSGAQKTMQCKIIREDAKRRMFVHSVTEKEVKTFQEAFEVFQMGQKRKHMGYTALNAESSRSHSVFNIRLVQAPKDYHGQTIKISQLSLVDLAGSERTSRSKNTGARLREAGNINNSLMTLRTCLEYLRENQQMNNGINVPKKIPYRDSKITHLFKSFFEGEGQVSMIVCINPRMEDYDESLQVLKFAEMTQEVQIPQATPIKATHITQSKIQNNQRVSFKNFENDLPKYEFNETTIQLQELRSALELRLVDREKIRKFLIVAMEKIRQKLLDMYKNDLEIASEMTPLLGIDKQKSQEQRSKSSENLLRYRQSPGNNFSPISYNRTYLNKPKSVMKIPKVESKRNIINQKRSQSSENLLRVKNRKIQTDIYATPRRVAAASKVRYPQSSRIPTPLKSYLHTYPNGPKTVGKSPKVERSIVEEAVKSTEGYTKITLPNVDKRNSPRSVARENKENISNQQRAQSYENLLTIKNPESCYVPAMQMDVYATPRRVVAASKFRYPQSSSIPTPLKSYLHTYPNGPKTVGKSPKAEGSIVEEAVKRNSPRSVARENKENISNQQRAQSYENLLTIKNPESCYVPAMQMDVYATPRRVVAASKFRYPQSPHSPTCVNTHLNVLNPVKKSPKVERRICEEAAKGTDGNTKLSLLAVDKQNSSCRIALENKESEQRSQSYENLLGIKNRETSFVTARQMDIYGTPRRFVAASKLRYPQPVGSSTPVNYVQKLPKVERRITTKLSLIVTDPENKENISNQQRSQSSEELLSVKSVMKLIEADVSHIPKDVDMDNGLDTKLFKGNVCSTCGRSDAQDSEIP